jgi:hypothetical protein
MRDTEHTQSMVAYEDGAKEVNEQKPIAGSKMQFGNANRMPQENKGYKQIDYPANPSLKRYGEHR